MANIGEVINLTTQYYKVAQDLLAGEICLGFQVVHDDWEFLYVKDDISFATQIRIDKLFENLEVEPLLVRHGVDIAKQLLTGFRIALGDVAEFTDTSRYENLMKAKTWKEVMNLFEQHCLDINEHYLKHVAEED